MLTSETDLGSLATPATHQVTNQVPVLEDYNAFEADSLLSEALEREGAAWAKERLSSLGAKTGSAAVLRLGDLANRNEPILRTHDRQGNRIDEVEYHPAYHELMALSIDAEAHALPWSDPRPGAHVARAATKYLIAQVENGHGCPIAMTFSAVPSLRHQPDLAEQWIPRLTSRRYDPRMIPADQKTGATIGMAMTEKQGGSDVRANTTRATPVGIGGPGQEYLLVGHKWFCSAPMSDAFLTLAYSGEQLSCFLVPRWLPDATRNPFFIQRLKDKLGNRSNASSEIEYSGTHAWMVGEEGRGVATIIEMVSHTRLECVVDAAAMVRQATVQAIHHTTHRAAFKKQLIDQPLMQNVLADLALESEAATTLMMRLSRAYDEGAESEQARRFARIATAVSKYWTCKRTPGHIYEAMECHGGNGYVEDSNLARLYREAPVNSIWEGSGNVICLDVLRAMNREPESVDAFFDELAKARGENNRLDEFVAGLKADLHDTASVELRARTIVGKMARALQATLLVQHAPPAVSDAYIAGRLSEQGDNLIYGTLPAGLDLASIIDRSRARLT